MRMSVISPVVSPRVRSARSVALWVALLLLFCAPRLHAQTLAGINGTVTDTSGASVANATVTRSYFVDQGYYSGRPHIPIIKQANKGATSVFTLSASAPAAINVSLVAAELSQQ